MKKALKFSLWGGLITSALVSIYSLFLTINGIIYYKEYIKNLPETLVKSMWEFSIEAYTNMNWMYCLLNFLFFAFIAVCLLLVILDMNDIVDKINNFKKAYQLEKAQKQQEKALQILDKYDKEQ